MNFIYLTHIFFHRIIKANIYFLIVKEKKRAHKNEGCLLKNHLKAPNVAEYFSELSLNRTSRHENSEDILSGHKIHKFYVALGQHKSICSSCHQLFCHKRMIFASVFEINMFLFTVTVKMVLGK